jgi:hypothetical protein
MMGYSLVAIASRLYLGPTHSLLQWMQGTFTPGVELLGREAGHSSAEVKNAWSYASIPRYVFMSWCLINQIYIFMAWYLIKHKEILSLPLPLSLNEFPVASKHRFPVTSSHSFCMFMPWKCFYLLSFAQFFFSLFYCSCISFHTRVHWSRGSSVSRGNELRAGRPGFACGQWQESLFFPTAS